MANQRHDEQETRRLSTLLQSKREERKDQLTEMGMSLINDETRCELYQQLQQNKKDVRNIEKMILDCLWKKRGCDPMVEQFLQHSAGKTCYQEKKGKAVSDDSNVDNSFQTLSIKQQSFAGAIAGRELTFPVPYQHAQSRASCVSSCSSLKNSHELYSVVLNPAQAPEMEHSRNDKECFNDTGHADNGI
ncbi:hypothetical protein ACA910_006721 [Epithemia clementina (nom. ined.)]